MAGEKLESVKKAAIHVLDLLSDQDKVSVVAFDDEIVTLTPGVQVTSSNRQEIKSVIRALTDRGSTDLGGGWIRGCQLIADSMNADGVNRCLLLTDGQANQGMIDADELAMHAREMHRRGVSTSTFGVGRGFNEHLLEAMSNQGGGKFYFIANPQEIPAIFAAELSELTAVVARGVELHVNIPQGVNVHVPGDWKQDLAAEKLTIFAGDMYSRQESEFYLRLDIPKEAGQANLSFQVEVTAKGADAPKPVNTGLTMMYADDALVDQAPLDREMLSRFAVVEVAEAANAALKLERMGRRSEARNALAQSIDEREEYLNRESSAYYKDMSARMALGMDEMDRKASHLRNYQDRKRINK
jgi:Ca-activated chloride channel family protein